MKIKKMPQCAKASGHLSRQNETIPIRRVLVVDEEPLICQLNTDILAEAGFLVDTAENRPSPTAPDRATFFPAASPCKPATRLSPSPSVMARRQALQT
jgi:hypothetical protein